MKFTQIISSSASFSTPASFYDADRPPFPFWNVTPTNPNVNFAYHIWNETPVTSTNYKETQIAILPFYERNSCMTPRKPSCRVKTSRPPKKYKKAMHTPNQAHFATVSHLYRRPTCSHIYTYTSAATHL